jgi:hypothetical protein
MTAQMNNEELVQLVEHIMSASGCVMDLDALLNRFEEQVDYPNASELIFNPPDGKSLSAAEVVKIATKGTR